MTHSEIEALLQTAEEDNKRGSFANAEKLAREVLQRLEENKTSASVAKHIRALLALSESLYRRGRAKEALPIAMQALDHTRGSDDPEIRLHEAMALRLIGVAYMSLSELAKSLEYHKKALSLDKELGNKTGVARHTGNIGIVYMDMGHYTKALEYFEKSLLLDEELGNNAGVANSMGLLANAYNHLCQYAKALEFYEKALVLNEELGHKARVAYTTGNLGVFYYNISEYKMALEYFERTISINEAIGDKSVLAVYTGNIGNVYWKLSNYAKALEYQMKALNLSEEIGYKEQFGYVLTNIGWTLTKIGRNEEAKEFFQRSLTLRREEIKSDQDVPSTLLGIGSLLAVENNFSEAIEKLEESLVLALKLGEKKDASEAHKELAAVYKKLGDTAKTLEHTEKHYALKEEIFNDDTRKRVEAFNFRVATANKERDLELARTKAEKAEQALLFKERELANAATSLAAQTELLGNFRQDLRKIVMRPDKINSEEIVKQVRNKLKELPCEQIDFSKFEGQFATVHPEFRAKLQTLYSDLTPQELRICMLLRVNLQSAAIARLMCLSERNIENHRYRIRKKLDLKREEDLAIYLAKL